MGGGISEYVNGSRSSLTEVFEQYDREIVYLDFTITGDYSASKTILLIEGETVQFDDIPVGAVVTCSCDVYQKKDPANSPAEYLYRGTSERITIQEGENAVNITLSAAKDDSGSDDSVIVEETSITMNQTELTMTIGNDPVTLQVFITPNNTPAEDVKWWSEDISVATVENGLVTAVGAGTAVITATAGDKSATCTVTVIEDTSTKTLTISGFNDETQEECSIDISYTDSDTWGDLVNSDERIFTEDYDYAPAGKIVKIYVDEERTVSAEIKSSEANEDTYNLVSINDKVSAYTADSYYLENFY